MGTLVAFFTYDSAIAVQREIIEVSPASWLFFVAFMVVVSIGCMELMTSLFIDSLLEEKNRISKKKTQERDERRKEVQVLIKSLFDAFDEDSSQSLDKDELQECLAVFQDEDTKALLEFVEIDAEKMRAAINVADIDGDGDVSSEEFTLALESIHEPPMKADIREVHQRVGRLFVDVNATLTDHSTEIAKVHEKLDALQSMMTTLLASKVGLTSTGLGPPSNQLPPMRSDAEHLPSINVEPPAKEEVMVLRPGDEETSILDLEHEIAELENK